MTKYEIISLAISLALLSLSLLSYLKMYFSKKTAASPSTCAAVVIHSGDDQMSFGISAFYFST